MSELLQTTNPRMAAISELYRSILGREPDLGGLEGYLNRTARLDLAGVIARTTEGLLQSREFRRRFAHNTASAIIADDVRATHPLVMSLGTNCQTSSVLKRHGLKDFSGPLDWLLSSPAMVAHCLNDRFETLLDAKYFVPLPSGEQAQHSFYLDRFGVDSVFTHINPLNPDRHDYVKRCARRFLDALDSGKPVLLMMLARPTLNIESALDELINALNPWPHARLRAVQLAHPTMAPEQATVSLASTAGPHSLYLMQPASKEMGVGWPDPSDDIRFLKIAAVS